MRKLLLPSALAVLLAAGAIGGTSALAQTKVSIASWGGAYSEAQRKAYYEPFIKDSGVQVLEDEWTGELSQIRAQVETKNYKWHVVDVETNTVIAGCDEGVLERIDYAKLGVKKEDFLPGAAQDCGVGVMGWATVFGYDMDQIKGEGPKNWADFWDVKKFPGKRSMYKQSPPGNLEFALLADGVPIADIYKVLKTKEGVDRAFKKMDQIKPHVIWWEAGAQAPQLLADKEVVMTTAWNGRLYAAVKNEKKNFKIVWDGQMVDYEYWTIPKGHPEKELAYKFLAFTVRPDRHADLSNYISYGPVLKAAVSDVDPQVLPHLPTAPENVKVGFWVDSRFWADNREALTERWSAWLAK